MHQETMGEIARNAYPVCLVDSFEGESPKAHMVIGQHQFDEGDPSAPIEANISTRTSKELEADVSILNPALKGNLVISGTWASLAPPGHADHGKSGKLSDADILIEKNRSSLSKFKVKLPAAAPEPSSANKVQPERIRILAPIEAAAPVKAGDALKGWFSYPVAKLQRKEETMVYVFVDGMRSGPFRIPALKP